MTLNLTHKNAKKFGVFLTWSRFGFWSQLRLPLLLHELSLPWGEVLVSITGGGLLLSTNTSTTVTQLEPPKTPEHTELSLIYTLDKQNYSRSPELQYPGMILQYPGMI